jgi:DNA-binding NtrC family response regulator
MECHCGAEGLALAAPQWHSIQLVIVDMGMPLMDGRQVLEAIRQRQPALPVLLTSGEAGLPAGMKLDASTQFLPKPFDMSALLNAIHRGLHRRS